MKIVVLILVCNFCTVASALNFPGKFPGKAEVKIEQNKLYTLSNENIAISWNISRKNILLTKIENKLTQKSFPQLLSPVFLLSDNKTSDNISDWLVDKPVIKDIVPKKWSSSKGKLFSGKTIVVKMENKKTGLIVTWRGELRDGANYIRSIIDITGNKKITLQKIYMNCNLHLKNVKIVAKVGKHDGLPAICEQMFFGIEVPFFRNSIVADKLNQGFSCKLPIKQGIINSFASVIGVYPKQQLRRSFLYYIERERARSYSPFLHYNCWFDLERKVSEKGMLQRINVINKEMHEKRGIKISSYVVDDGYDDYNKGFWVFDRKKFPHGFTLLAKRLAELNSHLGVWISPAGGYSGSSKRRKRAKQIGIKSLDLATKEYYKWFLNRHMRFLHDEQINYFKWDKLGGGISGHFMALMDIAHKLRKVNPELFINTTVGTWQSPFWLNHVDCTWRGGQDMGFAGVGDNRENWLTYRDGVSYEAIKKSGFIYPLNALMNHGIVFANGHAFAQRALRGTRDLRNEARSYFAGGYALQELYITPNIMKKEQWDAIAGAAKWAVKNKEVLVDAHFIGGNPRKLEVYGFAAWNDNKGTIMLRNPNKDEQIYKMNIGKIFELPKEAIKKYMLVTPFEDQRIKTIMVQDKVTITIKLKPFEVLVFDAVSQ